MGCVQSLFNPSKSRSPSPEKEFVPPTFETVVVTRQPKKSKTANDGTTDDDDDDDDDDIVSKCDDFEKYALDENGDRTSLHLVEATAVRTLAANTGSVAILGTTAKCKSLGGSPAVHQPPLTDRQQTWSPATASSPPQTAHNSLQQTSGTSKSQPQLEMRFVEATAVRTLAAETGSIAILGTTADPKPKKQQTDDGDQDAGSIHYVPATAVRQLAAETGSIAILASTAAVAASAQPPKPADAEAVVGPEEPEDLIPVGVREVLDAEPRDQLNPQQQREWHREQKRIRSEVEDDHHRIPLPVIHAMEMKPEVEKIFKTMSSVQYPSDKYVLPPRSTTVDGANSYSAAKSPVPAVHAASSDASARRPFLRQSNETSERGEIEDVLARVETWTPTLLMFAKCPPAKSKSLPSENAEKTGEPSDIGDGNTADKQHGVVRGSSLPLETDYNSTVKQQTISSTKRANENGTSETILDIPASGNHQSVIDPVTTDLAVEKPITTETTVTATTVVKPSTVIEPVTTDLAVEKPVTTETTVTATAVVKPHTVIKPATTDLVVEKPITTETTVTAPIVVKPSTIIEHATIDLAVEKPITVETTVAATTVVEPSTVIESTAIKPTSVATNVIEKAAAEIVSEVVKLATSSPLTVTETNTTGTETEIKPIVNESSAVVKQPTLVDTNGNGIIATTIEPAVAKLRAHERTIVKQPTLVLTNVDGIIGTVEPEVIEPVVEEPTDEKPPTLVETNSIETAEAAVVEPVVVDELVKTSGEKSIKTESSVVKQPGQVEPTLVGAVTVDQQTVQVLSKIENDETKTSGDEIPAEHVEKTGEAEGRTDGGPLVNGYDRKSEDRGETSGGGAVENGEAGGQDDADDEYRLTMIQSVREAVNRICEQAVEKTEAIVKSGRGRYNPTGSLRRRRDADESEAADCVSSEFSLPPPPPLASDPASMGQESSWPPPPPLSEAEEERTIAPAGFSFDLPDPPTEMDQMDSESDKLDISDEEMKATGLPSDDDDKTDTEIIGGTDADVAVMKPTTTTTTTAVNGEPAAAETEAAAAVAANDGADDRAATTIQAMYRGFRARKYVETVNAAAVKIQAGFRGYRVRQSLKNANAPSPRAEQVQPQPLAAAATENVDDSSGECWSDDDDDEDQKSVVSVTYAPLKEYDVGTTAGGGGERGQADGEQDGEQDVRDETQQGDDDVFEREDAAGAGTPTTVAAGAGTPTTVAAGDGGQGDDDDDVEALTNAAIKIQARVRGFAARKKLNDEADAK